MQRPKTSKETQGIFDLQTPCFRPGKVSKIWFNRKQKPKSKYFIPATEMPVLWMQWVIRKKNAN